MKDLLNKILILRRAYDRIKRPNELDEENSSIMKK